MCGGSRALSLRNPSTRFCEQLQLERRSKSNTMATLVVKHMPVALTDQKIKEFFDHYGAVEVRCLQGKMVLLWCPIDLD